MEAMSYLMSLPLSDMLHFFGASLPTSPEAIVDSLLAKVHGTG